jgi:hypothetical protein
VKTKRPLLFVGIALVALVAWIVYGTVMRSPSMTLRIVDARTGQPLEGAVVVVSWLLVSSINAGRIEYLDIQEKQTDADGRIQLAGWGPQLRLKGSMLDQPILRVFIRGYDPLVKTNLGGKAFGDGSTLKLDPKTSSDADYAMLLHGFSAQLAADFDMPPFQCEFKNLSRMVSALEKADEQLVGAGQKSFLPGEFAPTYAGCSHEPEDNGRKL